jgi:hypothetical protein
VPRSAPSGRLDVRFQRRSKRIRRLEPGCRWIFEKGVSRGSFRFVGEDDYFSREAVDPVGETIRLPNGFCGLGDDRVTRTGLPGLRQTVLVAWSTDAPGKTSFEADRIIPGKCANRSAR